MKDILSTLGNWIVTTGVKLVIALIVLWISFNIINSICKKLTKSLTASKKIDETLATTLIHAGNIACKVLVGICLVEYLGIKTSGISALIASLGVCVGLAVNGTLSNLAGGVMILITRPFNVGDYIEALGQQGTVEAINICTTKIDTVDNKVVFLPNSALSTGTIVNYSANENRRVDLTFSIGGNDPEQVKNLLLAECEKNEKVIKDPAPFARITDFGAGNGVKMQLRAWCKGSDYWDVYLGLLEEIQKSFGQNGIVIPFDQLDIHMKNN